MTVDLERIMPRFILLQAKFPMILHVLQKKPGAKPTKTCKIPLFHANFRSCERNF